MLLGFAAGLFGGMLGLGGSIVLIPGFTFLWGENQHLYQASGMIFNFFSSISALFVHRKAEVFVPAILKWLIPTSIVGILFGVWLSNLPVFAGNSSYLLARLFGVFLIYVVIYNSIRFFAKPMTHHNSDELARIYDNPSGMAISTGVGLLTGGLAGLLGIGAGTLCTPLQQICLKLPIKRAMSNSAAVIVSMSWLGATYKNITLPEPHTAIWASLKLAAMTVPPGILGGWIGGHLMHRLPRQWVRTLFIGILVLAIWKLLTTHPQ